MYVPSLMIHLPSILSCFAAQKPLNSCSPRCSKNVDAYNQVIQEPGVCDTENCYTSVDVISGDPYTCFLSSFALEAD